MEAIIKLLAEAGIQWLGWAVAIWMIYTSMKRETAVSSVLKEMEKILTRLTTIVEERLPSHKDN